MEAYREIIALAISTIDPEKFVERYLVKSASQDQSVKYYPAHEIKVASRSLRAEPSKINNELKELSSSGAVIRNKVLVHAATGAQLTGDAILAVVMDAEKIHTPYLAAFKILGFDYSTFMMNQLGELKETLTASDFGVLGVQPTRTKNVYLINDDKDNPIKITPGRNGGNTKWLLTKTGRPVDGYKGNMFGLYEYLTQHKNTGRSLNDKIKDCYAELKNGLRLSQSISDEIKIKAGLPITSERSQTAIQAKLFARPSVAHVDKHPEIPHKPLVGMHRYLRYRGITSETVQADAFKNLLGHELSIVGGKTEKTNYRQDDAIFEPLYFVYKDQDGRIINKEFKNYYTRKALRKLREKDPTEKRSFPRHTGPRAFSLFVSNKPKVPSHIVLIESPLDCLSFYQVHKNKPGYEWVDQAIYIANGGSMSEQQIPIIDKIISENKITNVMLASDKDMQGRSYNLTYLGMLGRSEIRFRVKIKDGEGTYIEALNDSTGMQIRNLFVHLESKKLTGGVSLINEDSGTSIRYFYTEENYIKVGQTIAQVRSDSSLKFRTLSPNNSKDWNDQLIGKKSEPPLLGSRPLVTWLKNRENIAKIDQLRLKEIEVGNMGRYFSISEEMKGVRLEIKKIVEFYSQGIDGTSIKEAQKSGVTLLNNQLIFDKKTIGKIESGRIVIDDYIQLPDLVENRLDLIQNMLNGLKEMGKAGIETDGIKPDSVLTSVGNKIYIGDSGKYHLFNIGIDMNFNPTPLYQHWMATNHPLSQSVDKLLYEVKKVLPEREFVSLAPVDEVVAKNDELYWNGKLGRLDEHGRFELAENRVKDNIPNSVYDKIEEFQKMGAEEYKRRMNYEKRIRIDVEMNLLVDKKVHGRVIMEDGHKFSIRLNEDSSGLADLLVKAGLQPAIIKVGEIKYSIQKPHSDTTQPIATEKRAVRLEDIGGQKRVLVGEMEIGVWNEVNQKIDLISTLGTPNEKIAKEIERLELDQRSLRINDAAKEAVSRSPEIIALKDQDRAIKVNASACQSPTEFAIAAALHLPEDSKKEIISAETLSDNQKHATLQSAWNSHARNLGKPSMETTPPLSDEQIATTLDKITEDIWVKGTCVLKEITNDPKWTGLIVEDNNEAFVKGYHNQELKPLYDLNTFTFLGNGFIRSNIGDRLDYHDNCVIAQDVQALVAYYQLNRDTIAYDNKVSLFAPADPGSLKLCVLSAALLKPKQIILIGNSELMESVRTYDRYLEGIDIKRISEGEIVANFHQDREISARKSNGRYEALKDAALPGALIDENKKELYLPMCRDVSASGENQGGGTIKVVPGEKATALITIEKGVYIPHVPSGYNDVMFVSNTINNEFIERTKAGDFTVLEPQKNDEVIQKIASKYRVPSSGIIKIDNDDDGLRKQNFKSDKTSDCRVVKAVEETRKAMITI